MPRRGEGNRQEGAVRDDLQDDSDDIMAEMILMVTMILFVMMYRRMVMIPMMA